MKKLFVVLTALLLVCSFGLAAAADLSGEISVLVRPDEGGVFEKYVPMFEEETGVKVTVDFVSWDDITSKTLTTLASGGGGYDVVFIPSADATKLMAGGWFEPINDMLEGEEDTFLPALVDFYSDADGNLLAVPWYSGASHFVYNQDILDKAGVNGADVKTWDDFMAACKAVKEAGAADYCFTPTAKYGANFYYGWGTVAHSFGGEMFDAESNILFADDPKVLEATKLYETGMAEGYFNPAGAAMTDYEALIEFGTGTTAFMINSSWSATQATSNPELSSVWENSHVTLVPGEGGSYLYAGGLGVLNNSDNKDAARAFIKYITSEEAEKDHAIKGGNLPTRVALFSDPDIAAGWKEYDNLAAQLEHGAFAPKLTWFEEWRRAAAEAIQGVISQTSTAEEALAWLNTETTRIIADAE